MRRVNRKPQHYSEGRGKEKFLTLDLVNSPRPWPSRVYTNPPDCIITGISDYRACYKFPVVPILNPFFSLTLLLLLLFVAVFDYKSYH